MAFSTLDLRTDMPPTACPDQVDSPMGLPDSWQIEDLPEDLVGPIGSDSSEAAVLGETSTSWRYTPVALFRIAPPIPQLPEPAYHFDLRQQWEGTVTSVEQGEFRATLKDLTNPDNPPEEATFSTEDLFAGDLRRLVPGAVFRWSIGFKTEGGQKERVSRIHFARLPGWSKRSVDRIKREAAELQHLFTDGSPST